jgi:hypothetical protein
VTAALGLVGAALGAAATIGSTIISTKQAEKASKRQAEYQQSLLDQQRATEAEEQRITNEANERNRAYGASLLDGNTQLDNALTGYNSEYSLSNDQDYSLLSNTLKPGSTNVQELFA